MQYETQGTIKVILDSKTFKNDFVKREFVITTQENYPQVIKLECIRDRCALLDGLQPGDLVKVFFNIRGNEYNDRYYVNLLAWKIEKITDEQKKDKTPEQPTQSAQKENKPDPLPTEPEGGPFEPGM